MVPLFGLVGTPTSECATGTYLRVCDGGAADAGCDGGPGAGGEHAGEQGVQVSCPQAPAVPLHALHVPLDQGLPQAAVVHPEVWVQDLRRGVTHAPPSSTQGCFVWPEC